MPEEVIARIGGFENPTQFSTLYDNLFASRRFLIPTSTEEISLLYAYNTCILNNLGQILSPDHDTLVDLSQPIELSGGYQDNSWWVQTEYKPEGEITTTTIAYKEKDTGWMLASFTISPQGETSCISEVHVQAVSKETATIAELILNESKGTYEGRAVPQIADDQSQSIMEIVEFLIENIGFSVQRSKYELAVAEEDYPVVFTETKKDPGIVALGELLLQICGGSVDDAIYRALKLYVDGPREAELAALLSCFGITYNIDEKSLAKGAIATNQIGKLMVGTWNLPGMASNKIQSALNVTIPFKLPRLNITGLEYNFWLKLPDGNEVLVTESNYLRFARLVALQSHLIGSIPEFDSSRALNS